MQIFANVLNNAVKFTPRGGHIWFTAERQSDEAVVRIRDTGIGIAPDVLPRVFDMFQQAEPILERSDGGLGIGLTLARRLVEMHEGRIEIRSPGPARGPKSKSVCQSAPVHAAKAVAGRTAGCGGAAQPSRADCRRQSGCCGDVGTGGVASGPRHQAGSRRRDAQSLSRLSSRPTWFSWTSVCR